MAHVKKNDMVIVITGKDKGKKGQVLEVLPKKGLVKVNGVALMTHHMKARKAGDVPGIKQIEGYINISNVKLASEK